MLRPTLLLVGLLTAAALLPLGSGCRRSVRQTELGLQTGRATDRQMANLQRLAARDTGCHPAALEPRPLHEGVYEVVGHGCDVVRHYVMGCRGRRRCRWEAVVPIEQQVAADFQCAPDTVWVQATGDPTTRQVTACGVSSLYHLRCWQTACVWTAGAP
jgi:hypothetical protein